MFTAEKKNIRIAVKEWNATKAEAEKRETVVFLVKPRGFFEQPGFWNITDIINKEVEKKTTKTTWKHSSDKHKQQSNLFRT